MEKNNSPKLRRLGSVSLRLIFILLAISGCVLGTPEIKTTLPDELQRVQAYLDWGDTHLAQTTLESYLHRFPQDVYAWRLYAITRKNSLTALPAPLATISPIWLEKYVQALQQPNVTARANDLRQLQTQAVEVSSWIDLDLANVMLQSQQYRLGEAHLTKASRCLPTTAEIHMTAAWLSLGQVNWAKAIDNARQAKNLNPLLVKPYLFEAAQNLIVGDYAGCLDLMRQVQLLFPGYRFTPDELSGYAAALRREILSSFERKLWRNCLKTIDDALTIFPNHPYFGVWKARVFWATGRRDEAAPLIEKSWRQDPYRLLTVQLYRRLLLHRSQYQQAFAIWKQLVPDDILYHPENLVRSRYLRLAQAATVATQNAPATLAELARAMVGVGWAEEAYIVYRQLADVKAGQYGQEQHRLLRHMGFIASLRQLLYGYYQHGQLNIVEIITRINGLARTFEIPLQTSPSQELDTYFLLVREVDPFAPKPGSLGEYLAAYNLFFDLGNNYGHIEARLMNGISLRRYHRTIWEQPVDYFVLTGDETQIDTYLGYHSGSAHVAGRAFLSSQGCYVALDTIRPALATLQNIYSFATTPVPMTIPDQQPDVFPYLAGVAYSLLHRSLQEVLPQLGRESDRWQILYEAILRRRLDAVQNHELGHLVDFPRFLPVYRRWPAIIEMLWDEKFSAQRIHERFESTAEMFGLAHTQDPYFYLFQETERLDIAMDGIFGMVYWAWYGKLPTEDPYYLTAVSIFQDIIIIGDGKAGLHNLARLCRYSRQELYQIAYEMCRRRNIVPATKISRLTYHQN